MNPEIRNFLILITVVVILFWWIFPSFVCEGFSNVGCRVKNQYGSTQQPNPENPLQLYDPALFKATAGSTLQGLLPQKIYPAGGITSDDDDCNYEKSDITDSALGYNLCSPSCCAPQYPPPFDVGVDPTMAGTDGKFVHTSYLCNNAWQDSGCVCMTKKQGEFLSSRGGNGLGNADIRSLE